ncbi:MAG: Tyrosine-tRNA ligase [Parcubacteria group bacterium GW2011_GWB1_43_8]|nr:MAG: Tyrosine-tRNA ligase [Parcubacteria group bacterium GW2011_GWB1_43_8]
MPDFAIIEAIMDLYDELKSRGLVYQVSNEESVKKLLNIKGASFYAGFDPSAESLQAGNLLIIITMKRLERAGLKPIVLVGGATGLIGDPSFKDKERVLKTEEDVEKNVGAIKNQLSRFFDFDKTAILANNYDWFKNYSFINFIRDIGKKFTISEMIAKEAVKSRMETGISFTEFSYALIQAYDFLQINEKYGCELEIGGSDQWGNITAGIELARKTKTKAKEVFGLTLPLVISADGKKFGKSEGNAVWLDANLTSPYHFYQFWINADDKDVIKFLKYYTFLSLEEIKTLENSTTNAPEKREAQKALAKEVTTFVHGEESFKNAEKISENLFGGKIKDLSESDLKQIFTDSSVVKLEKMDDVNISDFLVSAKVVDSKRQAREDVQNKAIEINGEKITEVDHIVSQKDFLFGQYLIAKRGKRDYKFISL